MSRFLQWTDSSPNHLRPLFTLSKVVVQIDNKTDYGAFKCKFFLFSFPLLSKLSYLQFKSRGGNANKPHVSAATSNFWPQAFVPSFVRLVSRIHRGVGIGRTDERSGQTKYETFSPRISLCSTGSLISSSSNRDCSL